MAKDNIVPIAPTSLIKALLALVNEAQWPAVGRQGAHNIAGVSQAAEEYLQAQEETPATQEEDTNE
jgi:hypothetical protein